MQRYFEDETLNSLYSSWEEKTQEIFKFYRWLPMYFEDGVKANLDNLRNKKDVFQKDFQIDHSQRALESAPELNKLIYKLTWVYLVASFESFANKYYAIVISQELPKDKGDKRPKSIRKLEFAINFQKKFMPNILERACEIIVARNCIIHNNGEIDERAEKRIISDNIKRTRKIEFTDDLIHRAYNDVHLLVVKSCQIMDFYLKEKAH